MSRDLIASIEGEYRRYKALAEKAFAQLEREELTADPTNGSPVVDEALLRSVAHAAYHVGQIVQSCRRIRGHDWEFLSIPPGGSEAYNRSPTLEKPADHAVQPSADSPRHRG